MTDELACSQKPNNIQEKKEKHNGIISFWKFAFCIMIILFHINEMIPNKAKIVFAAGGIGVEFFFLVSGYFLGKKALNYKEVENQEIGNETYKFMVRKIKSFFPYMLITYLISVPVFYLIKNLHKYQVINSIWDILFLQQSGIKYYSFINIAWYLSVMLVVMNILYPMILKYRKSFLYIIAPMIVFFVGGYIAHKYTTLGAINVWDGLVYKSFLRGLFEIALGVILYGIAEKIKNINFTKFSRMILTFIEIIGFISIFIIVNIENAHIKYDFIIILILSISISIVCSGKTLLLKFCNNKFFYFLEKLSFPMYLNQIWIITLIKYFLEKYNFSYYQYCFLAILIDIVVSTIIIGGVKIVNKNAYKVKRIFVKEN